MTIQICNLCDLCAENPSNTKYCCGFTFEELGVVKAYDQVYVLTPKSCPLLTSPVSDEVKKGTTVLETRAKKSSG